MTQTFELMVGGISAVNALNSFAKGYVQQKRWLQEQQRVEETWQKSFDWQKAQAALQNQRQDRKFAFEQRRWQEESAIRMQQARAAELQTQVAQLQLDRAKVGKTHTVEYISALGEALSKLNYKDPNVEIHAATAKAQLAKEYPESDMGVVQGFFDDFMDSGVFGLRTQVDSRWEDYDPETGKVVMKIRYADGHVETEKTNRKIPGLVEYLDKVESVTIPEALKMDMKGFIEAASAGETNVTLASSPQEQIERARLLLKTFEEEKLQHLYKIKDSMIKHMTSHGWLNKEQATRIANEMIPYDEPKRVFTVESETERILKEVSTLDWRPQFDPYSVFATYIDNSLKVPGARAKVLHEASKRARDIWFAQHPELASHPPEEIPVDMPLEAVIPTVEDLADQFPSTVSLPIPKVYDKKIQEALEGKWTP